MAAKRRHTHAKLSSVQIIALGFFIMILIGAILLTLPIATAVPGGASFREAFFTATSASCVTGLVLRDTGTYWSLFGQTVIIILIQIGGLGFMTMATLFMLLLQKRMGLRQREIIVDSINYYQLGGIVPFVKKILLGTFLVEGTGALLLSIRFIQDFGWKRGVYYGIWHSVSAFCNAGFDLMGPHTGEFSSFTAYAGDPLVNLTLMGLIVVGGAGFLVWDDLCRNTFHWRRYRLQTKLVLFMNAVLILGGGLAFFLLEKNNLGAGLSLKEQVLTSLFDAVTPRTAGFNTTDTAALTPGSMILTMLLMFIGGSPGSTAGGIKTTTFAVMVLYTVAGIHGSQCTNAFGRRIDDDTVKKSTLVFFSNLSLVVVGAFAICAAQPLLPIRDILFETFSAMGTVGMSTGVTRELAPFSQMVITFIMYCGRVGSVSFALALLEKRATPPVTLPREQITIG